MRELILLRRQRTTRLKRSGIWQITSIPQGCSRRVPLSGRQLVRSVHDQVSRNGFGSVCYRKMTEFLRLQKFAEFFAELCATTAPIAPITPLYSVENACTPGLSKRLLAEALLIRALPEEPITFLDLPPILTPR